MKATLTVTLYRENYAVKATEVFKMKDEVIQCNEYTDPYEINRIRLGYLKARCHTKVLIQHSGNIINKVEYTRDC